MHSSPSLLPSTGNEPIASTDRSRHGRAATLGVSAVAMLVAGVAWSGASPAYAAVATVGLGTAKPFAVLAGSAITNTGPSAIDGDVGIAPGESITGLTPMMITGATHKNDAVAVQAQDDLTTAYIDASNRPFTKDVTGTDLGGQTLVAGVYQDTSSMQLTGPVVLDAEGDSNAVFIFQAGSTLTTATASTVELINGADPCNVFWQVGSSATLGTATDFVGTILALTSATLTTGAKVEGRVLARNGAVTLDTNVITVPDCAQPSSETPSEDPSEDPSDSPSEDPSDTPSASPAQNPSSPGGAGDGGDGPGAGGTGDSTDAAGTGEGEPAGPSGSDGPNVSAGPDGPAGPGGDSTGPIVPVGHPETGLEPGPADRGPLLLYGLSTLAALGALVSFGRAARTPHTH